MNSKKPIPGVSRSNRLSEEGLQRLQTQLSRGQRISEQVLAQWIRRYGDAARDIIRQHGQYTEELDSIE